MPTNLIKNSKYSHAGHVTKNTNGCGRGYVVSPHDCICDHRARPGSAHSCKNIDEDND